MNKIPFAALKIGAERINESPVKYNKSRISGSQLTTYYLHSKAAYMPGQKDIFTPSPNTLINFNDDLIHNKQNSAFQQKCQDKEYKPLGEKFSNKDLDDFTFASYSPNDDESLEIAIKASYRQVFGNLCLMDSERPKDIERRLRNGDISIKQFIREISKSPIYLKYYFQNVSQLKCIKLTFKHILGRPIINQNEIIKSIIRIKEKGFESQIDYLLDSNEYSENFGEDIVPYMRSWSSEVGLTTSSFLATSFITKSFATSDTLL